MSGQICFFEKNAADFTNTEMIITASQGNDYATLALNRSNQSYWVTSGSVDADNTTFEINFVSSQKISEIILLLHNFKAYTIKYWDGSAYQDFSTAISESSNTADNKWHSFTEVTTTKILLTITGTMVSNADKYLAQFIATRKIGNIDAWAIIDAPTVSRNRDIVKMLSGKSAIFENVGFFSCNLKYEYLNTDADLITIEKLYASNDGFLVWLCGGDETQFKSVREGYRMEDIYLMKCSNEYSPKWYQGMYKLGIVLDMKLIEVVD